MFILIDRSSSRCGHTAASACWPVAKCFDVFASAPAFCYQIHISLGISFRMRCFKIKIQHHTQHQLELAVWKKKHYIYGFSCSFVQLMIQHHKTYPCGPSSLCTASKNISEQWEPLTGPSFTQLVKVENHPPEFTGLLLGEVVQHS